MKIFKIHLLSISLLSIFLFSCKDECKDIVCQNGGTCVEGSCVCASGFSGDNCELEDLCITQNVTCQNGGTCDDGLCDCPAGFAGTNCEIDLCASITCQNGGTCIGGACDCPTGFGGVNCEINFCDTINCQNGGTCISGACDCPAGYSGDSCQIVDRAKFIDNWFVSDVCNGTNYTYAVSISASIDISKVNINSFWDGEFVNPVIADVSGNDITIARQEPDSDGYFVEGSGTFANGEITWEYDISDENVSPFDIEDCTSTWQ